MSELRKTITIYFVSSDEKSTKRIVLPVAYFKLTAFFTAVVVLAFFAGFIDYFGLLAQSLENKKLKIENLKLKMAWDFQFLILNFRLLRPAPPPLHFGR